MKYDYLIVGSGLFGATFAHLAHKQGKRCLVIDKRSNLGGNIYCENIEGINVHKYGAHIFHTSNKKVWDFVNSIVEFNRYTNSPVANYKRVCHKSMAHPLLCYLLHNPRSIVAYSKKGII